MVDLYYQDTAKPVTLRQIRKIKYEHIVLNLFSKMRVDLAAQVKRIAYYLCYDAFILYCIGHE